MGRLNGRLALVTGGGGLGIGHGISLELAREGARVVVAELDLAAAGDICRRIQSEGGQASALRCDVSRAEEIEAMIAQIIRDHQRLDVLVNNAGIGLIRPPADATEAEFDRLMSVDLRGVWLCCKFAIPHMQRQKRGSIINIASVHSRMTMRNYGVYAAMKAGVAGLTRGIAAHYGTDGIRANTVSPGLVDSPQNHEIIAQFAPDFRQWMQDFVEHGQALPWLIQPEDIGRTVAFLASDDARAITGAEIPVDAGVWIKLNG
ncbi:MAG TPA: SDR family oxidoreductase [Terriglobia bacterium]|nr:SDR family oxidoreductase [Terriglobia bacterium]